MAIKDRIAERMLLQIIPNDVWDRIKKADSKRWVPPKINIEKFMKKYNPNGYKGKIKL